MSFQSPPCRNWRPALSCHRRGIAAQICLRGRVLCRWRASLESQPWYKCIYTSSSGFPVTTCSVCAHTQADIQAQADVLSPNAHAKNTSTRTCIRSTCRQTHMHKHTQARADTRAHLRARTNTRTCGHANANVHAQTCQLHKNKLTKKHLRTYSNTPAHGSK